MPLPTSSCGLPADSGGPPSNVCAAPASRCLLTLLLVGFTEPPQSPAALVVSYTTVSPLPPGEPDGGLFSVALSRGSPRVGVTHHLALWSPDFPQDANTLTSCGRPADSSAGVPGYAVFTSPCTFLRTCSLGSTLVLILLPPSQGKTPATSGPPVDVDGLSLPALTHPRERVLDALIRLSSGQPGRARRVLGLTSNQQGDVERNQLLREAPAQAAAHTYSGVVYDALGYASLGKVAQRRINSWVLVFSALWGAVHLDDAIPAYRLSGDVKLSRLGSLQQFWRRPLEQALTESAGGGPILDLRSGTYAKMWVPNASLSEQVVVGRVLQQMPDGSHKVVSHHNKATKGRLVRALAEQTNAPQSVSALVAAIDSLGVKTHLHERTPGKPWQLDIIVGKL